MQSSIFISGNKIGFVDSIAHWATTSGKVAGLVTTTTITHASPSPLYAHIPTPMRKYQYNSSKLSYPTEYPKCIDIAQQFLLQAQHIKVAMGGGRANVKIDRIFNFLPYLLTKRLFQFMPDNVADEYGNYGLRTDNRDLIQVPSYSNASMFLICSHRNGEKTDLKMGKMLFLLGQRKKCKISTLNVSTTC